MSQRRIPFAEVWRVLAYTLAIALGFVALGRLQLALFDAPATVPWLQRLGWIQADPAPALRQRTAEIAAASAAAMRTLAPGHRSAAWRLGCELGYASQLVGVRALSAPEAQALGRKLAAPHAQRAAEIAAQWGLGAAQPLGARSLREFTELGARYEADEDGLAARVEQRLSPLHRELYLLGAQLGGEAARIEDSGGQFSLPPAPLIARHATLAGIEPRWWQPLAAPPAKDEPPKQVLQRYRAALEALAGELRRLDAAAAAPAAGVGR
ncbi:MAG TPA: hypothetical protein PLO07_13740 [Rubrivivax sp.]|nr:hypothetical protein [Rubrivivax sp.]